MRLNEWNKTGGSSGDRGEAPSGEAIASFRDRLDRLLLDGGSPEDAINALLAFYDSRCDRASELRTLGDVLFDALNKSAPQTFTGGRYRDRHVFLRANDQVYLLVDGEGIARLPLDEAIRLATLMHGAPHTGLGDRRAA